MSRYTLLIVACVALAPALFAQETKVEFCAGIVLGVDSASRLLSIEVAGLAAEKRTFSVPAETDIRKQGRTIVLSSIGIGEPVSIEYESTPSRLVARSVEVLTKPESSSAKR